MVQQGVICPFVKGWMARGDFLSEVLFVVYMLFDKQMTMWLILFLKKNPIFAFGLKIGIKKKKIPQLNI